MSRSRNRLTDSGSIRSKGRALSGCLLGLHQLELVLDQADHGIHHRFASFVGEIETDFSEGVLGDRCQALERPGRIDLGPGLELADLFGEQHGFAFLGGERVNVGTKGLVGDGSGDAVEGVEFRPVTGAGLDMGLGFRVPY
jgi:hypothetical protein